MEQALIPVVVGKTDSGENIFFTPGNFTQAFYNQERAAQKNTHQQ